MHRNGRKTTGYLGLFAAAGAAFVRRSWCKTGFPVPQRCRRRGNAPNLSDLQCAVCSLQCAFALGAAHTKEDEILRARDRRHLRAIPHIFDRSKAACCCNFVHPRQWRCCILQFPRNSLFFCSDHQEKPWSSSFCM